MIGDYGAVCRVVLNNEIEAGDTVMLDSDIEISIRGVNKIFSTEFGIIEATR